MLFFRLEFYWFWFVWIFQLCWPPHQPKCLEKWNNTVECVNKNEAQTANQLNQTHVENRVNNTMVILNLQIGPIN